MHLETSDTGGSSRRGRRADGTNPFIDTLALATGFDVWGRELAGDRGDPTEGSVGICSCRARSRWRRISQAQHDKRTHSSRGMVYPSVLAVRLSGDQAVGAAAMQQVERLNGMAIVKVLGRVWILLVVLLVIGCGGFIVSRVHGIFGSEKRPAYAEVYGKDTKPFNPKHLVYEVFGPAGTVADISYFDQNSESQHVDGVSLPWSLTMTSDSAAVVGSIVAQGDSNSIGCRILVDAEVKAERISNGVNAFTHCLLGGA